MASEEQVEKPVEEKAVEKPVDVSDEKPKLTIPEEKPMPKPTMVERALSARISLPIIGTGKAAKQILTDRAKAQAAAEEAAATDRAEGAAATKLQAMARGNSHRRMAADKTTQVDTKEAVSEEAAAPSPAPANDGGMFGWFSNRG